MSIKWIRQEDAHGCGVAALAMLLGKTYAEVKADFERDFTEHGMTHVAVDAYLAEHGYAVRRIFQVLAFKEERRAEWPVSPFAPLHLCEVQPKGSINKVRFVVMLASGVILDPDHNPQDGAKHFSDYDRVFNIAGIYRVDK